MEDSDALAELNLLMEKARNVAGSYYKLAKLLDMPEQRLSDFRHGRRNATPEDCALFAAIAGVDPIQEMARAVLRKHDGSKKGELLRKALGKPLLATGAVLASAGAHAGLLVSLISGSTAQGLADFVRCISGVNKRQGSAFA